MRTVIGLLSDAREAKRTADDLQRIGARDISVISRDGSGSYGPLAAYLAPSGTGGGANGVQALTSMGLSQAEAQRYIEGLRSGYMLEAATIEDDKAEQALAIMKQHAATIGGGAKRAAAQNEVVLPVIAEELRVGKREVEAGGVRVTSNVQEVPVQERIQLREERVDVERRPVNRPLVEGDQAFREQTLEVTATSEEPIVGKEARVVEEVVVRKGQDVRTETINDVVRRQDVDVEQLGSDEYAPAYQYGQQLRQDRRFASQSWDDIEPNARADWEKRSPGTWERFKAAVKHAWEGAKS